MRKLKPITMTASNGLLKMYLVLISVICHQVLAADGDSKKMINKCCEIGSGLVQSAEESSYYDCVEFNPSQHSIIPLSNGEKSQFIVGFPKECQGQELFVNVLNETTRIPLSYCLDKVITADVISPNETDYEGKVIVLTCESFYQKKSVLSLRKVKKCCKDGEIYNNVEHICQRKLDQEKQRKLDDPENNSSLFDDFVKPSVSLVDVKYGLKCGPTQKVIEYNNDLYNLNLQGSDVRITHKTKGSKVKLKEFSFCVDENQKAGLTVRGCQDTCHGAICVAKCCPPGQVYVPRSCAGGPGICKPNTEIGFSPTFYKSKEGNFEPVDEPETIGISYGLSCKGRFLLNISVETDVNYLDVTTGHLVTPLYEKQVRENYCLEILDESICGGGVAMRALTCFDEKKSEVKFLITAIAISISCVFLMATLLVYSALPELRNLHGKTLMCYVLALLTAFSCLARVQFAQVESRTLCSALGYIVYFSFVAAFSWLNIMCFDIWWTFGSVRTVNTIKKPNAERRRFMYYSLYSWGLTLLLTSIVALLDAYPVSPYLDPDIGSSRCWFRLDNLYPVHILFVMPMGILITINLVLFILTAIHCNKIKSEIHRLQAGSMGERRKRSFLADRAKYVLNFKLFIVMGITWVYEILSTVLDTYSNLWIIGDSVNMLQGIPIFCILVLKPKVYRLIKKKLGLDKGDGKSVTTSTNRTTSTLVSNTSSYDERRCSHPKYSTMLSINSDKSTVKLT